MIKVNDIVVEPTTFPDGTYLINFRASAEKFNYTIEIDWRYEGEHELSLLFFIAKHLRNQYTKVNVSKEIAAPKMEKKLQNDIRIAEERGLVPEKYHGDEITDAVIDEVVVYCHSDLGDQYFGGITYNYTVKSIPANGTAEIDAVDCILGLAKVVRIVVK